jgi:benzoate-CoA ligase family protein
MEAEMRFSRQNAAWHYLDRNADGRSAAAPCLVDGAEVHTYWQARDLVTRISRVLTDSGIGHGDRVVIILPDSLAAVASILAVMRSGAIAVPLSPALTVADHHYVLLDSGAAAVIAPADAVAASQWPGDGLTGIRAWDQPSLLRAAASADPVAEPAPVAGDDAALIQYTSGSTGKPKGVVHTHRGLLAFPSGLGAHLGITQEDRCFSTAKLSFGYGFGNSVLLPFSVGASAVMHGRAVEPHAVASILRSARPTMLFSVPTLYAALLAMPNAAQRLDFSSVRLAVSAGEHLGAGLCERLRDTFGLSVLNGLGATECLHIFLATAPGDWSPGSTGHPVAGFEIEVRGDGGRRLADGEPGQLHVRGSSLGDRYWNRPQQSAATFRGGWVRTGDMMRREPDGGWSYIGRADDILNIGGMKVPPTEIEEEIRHVPGVSSCAVIGVADSDELIRIVAYVAPCPDAAPGLAERIHAELRTRLPAMKRPREIRVVDQIPTSSTGKIVRFAMRAWEKDTMS